ncbi:glycerol-3-phosphate acyltransferase 3 [Drosophila serrata]|uniref:glycerol-3-phosphate acyltransferase 3 n=1 Tax=Drosophila serrata TaxID=7274 RepID=UPI000A1D33E9|nr:glycerol-3-phosphate acyltransferase 3 [Drosophila serrata]XP_020797987.1 glycerol-3-phosphate acyltransferase 3 [Drosophila serrata]
MLLLLATVCLICWSSIFWLQALYINLLERLFAWINQELKDTRKREMGQSDLESEKASEQGAIGDGPKDPAKRLSSPHIKSRLVRRVEQMSNMVNLGMELILEDEVTPHFVAAPTPPGQWNLLTRNLGQRVRDLHWRLWIVWLLGWLTRYVLLLPLRTLAAWASLFLTSIIAAILGQLPESHLKQLLVEQVLRQCFRIMAGCLPIIRRYHNTEHRPTMGICVCNHTSPLDVLVLMSDAYYTVTGQIHDGIIGLFQRALSRVSPQMWFDRRLLGDREALGCLLRLHGGSADRPPILLFPEGTCINNTAVMQFRKGSFAVSDVVYPLAISYDRRFSEAFWNSSRHSMLRYMFMLVSSWCIACDVWYMAPVRRLSAETPVEFSNRVKAAIAAQVNIDSLPWDGNLKRATPVRDWQE